jgi:hypothetical protein
LAEASAKAVGRRNRRCCSTSPWRFIPPSSWTTISARARSSVRSCRTSWARVKVREAGLLAGKRAVFFLVDIDAPEELYELFGPEIYSQFAVEAHPVVSVEKAGEIFQRWAAQGR